MAERTLRERCIEAMARSRWEGRGMSWDALKAKGPSLNSAARDFDAVLGVLTEHAGEWIDATGPLEWHDWSERVITHGLLAVLGEVVSDE